MEEGDAEEAIIQAQPELLKRMVVTANLLVHLEAAGVIDIFFRETLESKATNHEKVGVLLDHLRRDIGGRYDPFIKALKETSQQHVVALIEEASRHLSVEQEQQAKDLPRLWMPQLMEEYQHFCRTLPIFKDSHEHTIDMTKLFTKLELICGSESMENATSDDEVSLEEVLDGTKRNIILQGSPGCGKTSAIIHILTTSGEAMLPGIDPGNPKYKAMKDINVLYYLRPEDCRESLEETIKYVLEDRCPEYAEQAYRHYMQYPRMTGIVLDSLDEISNKRQLVKDVLKEMKRNQRVIVAGCRSHDQVLDPLIHAKHVKHVRVKGFELKAIISFVEKYFSPSDETTQATVEGASVIVEAFKQSLEEDEHLQGLLTNPMSLSLVCILIKAGRYDPKSLSGLTKIQLYSDIEEFALRRQGLKVKNEEENLRIFHKYALSVMVQNSGFYQDDMEALGINVSRLPFIIVAPEAIDHLSKGRQILWPHKSFSEYSAAKCILECEQYKQEELLIYLAGHRHLINTLIFILELMEPEEELLKRVINYVLALQLKFTRPRHVPFCQGKATETTNKNIGKTNINDILEQKKGVIKFKCGQIYPCKRCWKSLNFATTVEGQAILHNALACLQTNANEEVHNRVFSNTLSGLLPKKMGGDGISIPVPDTDRKVNIREREEGEMVLTANRPSDVLAARPYLMWGNREIQTVTLDLHKQGTMYGQEEHSSTKQDWVELLQDFTTTSSSLMGKGSLDFLSINETLMEALPGHLDELEKHGVKQITMKVDEDDIMDGGAGMKHLAKKGWQVIYSDGSIHMSLKDWPQLLTSIIRDTPPISGMGLLYFESDFDKVLRALPSKLKDLGKHGVKIIMMKLEEDIKWRKVEKDLKDHGWHVVYSGQFMYMTVKDWPLLLEAIIRNTPPHTDAGSLHLPSSSDDLLQALPEKLRRLKECGFNTIWMKDVDSNIRSRMGHIKYLVTESWQVIYNEQYICMSHKDWSQILEDIFMDTPFVTGKSSLYILSDNDKLLQALPYNLENLKKHELGIIMMKAEEDDIRSGQLNLTDLKNQGWQVIWGDQYVYTSLQEWPQILKGIVRDTPPISGEGLLCIQSNINDLLQALPSKLKDLAKHGVKMIMLKMENDTKREKVEKDLKDHGWHAVYSGQYMYMTVKDWPLLLEAIIRNTPPHTDAGSLHLPSSSDDLLQALIEKLRGLKECGFHTIWMKEKDSNIKSRDARIRYLMKEGWQVIYNDQYIHMTLNDWPVILRDTIRDTPTISGNGSLNILSDQINNLLQALPDNLKALKKHGLESFMIMMAENNISAIKVTDVLENGWKIFHADGWLNIASPNSPTWVDYTGSYRLLPVPGTTSRWVKIKGGEEWKRYPTLYIHSHQPEDVITSQALNTVSRKKRCDRLHLYINERGDYYTDTPQPYIQGDTWRHLLEEVGKSRIFHKGKGWLYIHNRDDPSHHPEEVNCYDYDSLLEVLPGLITQLHESHIRYVLVDHGRVEGRSVKRFVAKLRETFDVRESTLKGTTGIYKRGTEDNVMDILLDSPVIRVSSQNEKKTLQEIRSYIKLYEDEMYEECPE